MRCGFNSNTMSHEKLGKFLLKFSSSVLKINRKLVWKTFRKTAASAKAN